MKNLIRNILLGFLLLSGCSKGGENQKNKLPLIYSNVEEKILNETFLQVIGTELYYSFSERHLDKVRRMKKNGASEKEVLEYYHKNKEEDSKRLIVFIRDKFLGVYYSKNASNNLHPKLLSLLHDGLVRGGFIETSDSATHILDALSQPLEISSIHLSQTGRYELVMEKDKNKVKGEYKSYGSFNSSKIYVDKNKQKAVYFFERDCMEGTKCSSGTLVILEKENGHWQVSNQINIYLS